MKTKQELGKTLVETRRKYQDIIFGNDFPMWRECLNDVIMRKCTI